MSVSETHVNQPDPPSPKKKTTPYKFIKLGITILVCWREKEPGHDLLNKEDYQGMGVSVIPPDPPKKK